MEIKGVDEAIRHWVSSWALRCLRINSAKDPIINHEILQSLCSFRMTLCIKLLHVVYT